MCYAMVSQICFYEVLCDGLGDQWDRGGNEREMHARWEAHEFTGSRDRLCHLVLLEADDTVPLIYIHNGWYIIMALSLGNHGSVRGVSISKMSSL